MRRHEKKMIAAVLVLLLTGGLLFHDGLVRLYVRMDRGTLDAFALEALEECADECLSTRWGIWDVTVWKQGAMVEFHTQQGPAFGGVEKGFYYSGSDTPNSFQATGYPMAEEGAGWSWKDPYGSHGYTQRIRPCWFWYEAVL